MLLKTILPVLSLTSLALAENNNDVEARKAQLLKICSTGPVKRSFFGKVNPLNWFSTPALEDLQAFLPSEERNQKNDEDKIELLNSPLNDEMHNALMTTMIYGQENDANALMKQPYIKLSSTDLNGNNALHHGCRNATSDSAVAVMHFLQVTGNATVLAGRAFDLEALNNEGQTAKQICQENNAINMTELAWPEAPIKEEEEEEEENAESEKEEADDSSASVASGSVIALISAFSFALLF